MGEGRGAKKVIFWMLALPSVYFLRYRDIIYTNIRIRDILYTNNL
jgi:hypothetical protein